MPFNIRLIAERRISLKTFSNRARRYLPAPLYSYLLTIRYFFFTKRCVDLARPQLTYSDGSWINRKTTADLRRISSFLSSIDTKYSVLQVGIGNSSLYENIHEKVVRFVGITIVQDEIDYARERFPQDFGRKYDVHLMNKYSDEIASLDPGFDFIVDNDLSSYACCIHHFHTMLKSYKQVLSSGGAILVGINGLEYFDSGFGLTTKSISRIARAHGLRFYSGEQYHMLKKFD